MGCKIRHLCVLCYFGLEKLKEESFVVHFDNGSKITTTKNPSSYKNTRVARKKKKLLLSLSCLPVSLHFRLKLTSQWTDFCDLLC
jgi:hypothetical protein